MKYLSSIYPVYIQYLSSIYPVSIQPCLQKGYCHSKCLYCVWLSVLLALCLAVCGICTIPYSMWYLYYAVIVCGVYTMPGCLVFVLYLDVWWLYYVWLSVVFIVCLIFWYLYYALIVCGVYTLPGCLVFVLYLAACGVYSIPCSLWYLYYALYVVFILCMDVWCLYCTWMSGVCTVSGCMWCSYYAWQSVVFVLCLACGVYTMPCSLWYLYYALAVCGIYTMLCCI